MKTLRLFLVLGLLGLRAFGQQPQTEAPALRIESADFAGVAADRISPALREGLRQLVGQPYEDKTTLPLRERLQSEMPEYVVLERTDRGSQPDRIRLVVQLTKIADNEGLRTNINERYVVEAVEVAGPFKTRIPSWLNGQLQAMVGDRLDMNTVGNLRHRIENANLWYARNKLRVRVKLRPGTSAQKVRIVYDVEDLRAEPGVDVAGGTYHSKQGWGIPRSTLTDGYGAIGQFSVSALNDPDPLIERYSGFEAAFRTKLDGIGLDLTYSSLRAQWKPNTLLAALQPSAPAALYRLRDAADVGATVPVSRPRYQAILSAGGFVGVAQMEKPFSNFTFMRDYMRDRGLRGSIEWVHRTGNISTWKEKYEIRSGIGAWGSDFIYTRHQWSVDYRRSRIPWDPLDIHFKGGLIAGNAPMFQRFSLGNSDTLRGWTKYEINPLGEAASRIRDFQLLNGKTLRQLKDGASLTYTVQLSVMSSRTGGVLSRVEYRFALSLDIFEEKFQVTRLHPSMRVLSHLSLAAAESACLEGFEIDFRGLRSLNPRLFSPHASGVQWVPSEPDRIRADIWF